MINCQKINE